MVKRAHAFQVILLSGWAGSGKDTFGYRLTNDHGYARTYFAKKLKSLGLEILKDLDCRVETDSFDHPDKKEKLILDQNGQPFNFIQKKNDQWVVCHLTFRQFAIDLGTPIGRESIHRHIWVMPVVRDIRQAYLDPGCRGIVVTDFRYPDEYEVPFMLCRSQTESDQMEFTTVRIIRPDVKQKITPSETSLDDFKFDVVIKNDGSIADLFVKADKLATGQWKLDMAVHRQAEKAANSFLGQYEAKKGG